MEKQAIVLLSGGLDSTTVLAFARNEGFKCHALTFDYNQRHLAEINAAKRVAQTFSVESHHIIPVAIDRFGGSALTDNSIEIPESHGADEIPVTYVPARNTIFLSYALAYAEVTGARDIFIGANVVDYSNYPDCRPEYLAAFEKMANLATKAGISGDDIKIHAPIVDLNKAEIIKLGTDLGIDYSTTVSCYQADLIGAACGKCLSCRLRKRGFKEAGLEDPTVYKI